MIAVRILIEGRVQGVGYRNWAARNAHQLGLTGWVRNLENGSVEAQLQGDQGVVRQMIDLCYEGPAASKVTAITETPCANDHSIEGFEIHFE